MTIYMPDDLAAEVKDKLGDTNISAICQAALRDELGRVKARAEITAESLERVEVYQSATGRFVAFRGRQIADSRTTDQQAWLTARGAIAVYDGAVQKLVLFADYSDLIEPDGLYLPWPAQDLLAEMAAALGEKYVEELDV